MRRSVLFFLIAFMSGFYSYSQGPLTKNWEILSSATAGALIGTASQQTTVAYNKTTEKLYLPERNNKISILNPLDGTLASPKSELTVLTTAPAWTQSYKYTKIRVTDQGVIYACNMTTGAGTVYIYRWASEADETPTTSAITVGSRTGDSFSVTGSGVNTVIYLSGSGNSSVYVCTTTDGINFTLSKTITLAAASDARSSISAVSNGTSSDIWINAPNIETKRISTDATGAITSSKSIASATVNQVYANTEFIQEGSEKYLAVTGAVIGASYNATTGLGFDFKLYKVTDFASPPTTGVTEVGTGKLSDNPAASPNTFFQNANAYADVAYKKNGNGTYTFYNVIASNGLAAYTTATPLPVTLTSFLASLTNNQNTLNWTTSSENNSAGFEIESSTDGVTFNNIGFVASKGSGTSSGVSTYAFQDKNAASGTTYYLLKQVDKDGKFEYSAIKYVNNTLSTSGFSIYPNPAVDYVEISGADMSGVTLQLFTTNGAEINTSGLLDGNRLNVSGLTTGIYILRISKDGQINQTSRLIKQ